MHSKPTNSVRLDLPLVTGSYLNAVPRNPVIARMLKAFTLLLIIALSISTTAIARQKGGGGGKPFLKILDVDAVSITLSIGSDGNSHQKYVVNDSTKVTLNGAPANARDLRAGMVAKIEASEDGKTALVIDAKDAPAHPARGRTG
jgi:hypothetical protein